MIRETSQRPTRPVAARGPRARSFAASLTLFAVATAAVVALDPRAHAAPAAPKGRLIVLGFDGADARTVELLMQKGEMPNCARLRDQGTFAPLGTTMPAESPVSWASLNSGQNPAKTGIAGFVKRTFGDDGAPLPGPGHVGHEARSTDTMRLPGVTRFLSTRAPGHNAAIFGGASFVVFLFVFAYLLKIRRGIALFLAALLGGAGAFGAWTCSSYVPREISDVVTNPTKSRGFWEVAAEAGVPCVVIDAAMEWDRPDVPNLKLLAGLGVPDVRASNGDWFVYTTRDDVFARVPEGESTDTGGLVFRVDEYGDRIETVLYGPRNFWAIDRARIELASLREELADPKASDAKVDRLRARIATIEESVRRLESQAEFSRSQEGRCHLPIEIVKHPAEKKATVTIGGVPQEIAEGQWSNWYRLTFELNPLVKVKAITRAKLESLTNPFRLYVDVLQIDPADPVFWQPVSRPASFAPELAHSIDVPYETVGWACMTMPFKDREIDPITFLEDIEATHTTRVKLLRAALARDDWRVLVDVESTPDRVQHMMYQYYDEGHPLYDAAEASRKATYFGREIALRDAIPATYRELDRLVGEVMDGYLEPGDTLILCADHGFQSFRRQVHLNNWLAREGYLVLKPGVTLDDRRYLKYVDWTRTRAYAVGLGMVFLNRAGREPHGIVDEVSAPGLLDEISAKLLALKDPVTGASAVESVYRMDRIHSGPYLKDEADLMPGFAATYRVSWASTTGGIALDGGEGGAPVVVAPEIEDNELTWSGDHVSVAEHLVRGIFFSNRRIVVPEGGVNLLHVAPTALSVVGVPIPAEYDAPPLNFVR